MKNNNRAIKFRVIRHNKIFGYEWLNPEFNNWVYSLVGRPSCPLIGGVITFEAGMIRDQFTGLLDKNKKEIFERDFVKIPTGETCSVEYVDGTPCCCSGDEICEHLWDIYDESEIVEKVDKYLSKGNWEYSEITPSDEELAEIDKCLKELNPLNEDL